MKTIAELDAEAELLWDAGRYEESLALGKQALALSKRQNRLAAAFENWATSMEEIEAQRAARAHEQQMLRLAAAFENWTTSLEPAERKSDDADG